LGIAHKQKMKSNLRFFKCCAILILGVNLCSCGKPSKKLSQEELIKDIVKFSRDNKLEATVKLSGKTLYIYIPVEQIFTPSEKPKTNILNYDVDTSQGIYQDYNFDFKYLINKLNNPEKKLQPYDLDKKFSKIRQKISYYIGYKLMNANTEILFFVEIYADVKTGLILATTTYLNDIKKFFCGVLPLEEYSKRITQDILESSKIIGDKSGAYIQYRDIEMGEFLSKLISQRIRYHFQGDYKISKPAKEIVQDIVQETLNSYKFKDYLLVQIKDLSTENLTTLTKNEVERNTKP
jgi:hypothetical protein